MAHPSSTAGPAERIEWACMAARMVCWVPSVGNTLNTASTPLRLAVFGRDWWTFQGHQSPTATDFVQSLTAETARIVILVSSL